MLNFFKTQKFVDFNMNDKYNESPIFEAIYFDDLQLVKYLIEECKVDYEHKEVQDRTPLYYACSIGKP